MPGSHRTSPRSVARRRTTLAAGAVLASTAIALAPVATAAAATRVDSVQLAENEYATWENLAKILASSSKAQDSVLGVAAKPLPSGWVPTSTTAGGTTTTQVGYLTALTQAGGMVLTPVNTSGVPGIPGLAGVGVLPAQAVLGVPVLTQAGSGGAAAGKIGAAWGALNVINGQTVIKNGAADIAGSPVNIFRTTEVRQHAGQLTGIPTIGDALALLPSGTRTTTNWSNTVAWPLLQAGGTTWLVNDRLTVSGVNSQQIKDALGANLNDPNPLILEQGKMVSCGFLCKKWQPTLGPDGQPLRVVTYDPSTLVPGALNLVDGIDVPGFTVIKKGAGGSYSLPGNGKVGWLGQSTQVIIPAHGNTPATVATVPVVAGGLALPFELLTVGGLYSPGVVTQSGQSLNATLGTRSFGLGIPRAGLGFESTSAFESWHVGPDGININTGQAILLPQTGALGIPAIPLIYSMGAYNVGPNGLGISGPSVFGIGLPNFQIGSAPASGGVQIPPSLISLDPKLLFAAAGITDPTGLGLTDPFGTSGRLLTPLYQGVVTPIATPLTQAGFDLGSDAIDKGGKHAAEGSGNVAEIVERVSGKVVDTATTVEPVVPAAPATPLDDVTVKPVTDAVDTSLDTVQESVEEAADPPRPPPRASPPARLSPLLCPTRSPRLSPRPGAPIRHRWARSGLP